MVNKKRDMVGGIRVDEYFPDGLDKKTDINKILKKHNSSIEIIIGKLLPGLDASRDIKDRDGDLIETVPDWTARTKVGTLILTAAGLMKNTGDVNVNVGMTAEEKEVEDMFKVYRKGDNG